MDFSDKIILVTGGTSGIGLSTAISLVKHNAKIVYVCGRSLLKWDIAKVLIEKTLCNRSDRIKFIQTDIRIEYQVKRLIKTIFNEKCQLDACFNNVGVNNPPVKIWNTDFGESEQRGEYIYYKIYAGEEKYKQTPIFTNYYGTCLCLKWELYYILKYNNPRKQVNILNMASSINRLGLIGYSPYTSSKGGVATLTKCVAGEVAQTKAEHNDLVPVILINSLSPGYVNSPLFTENIPQNIPPQQVFENVIKTIPLGYIQSPESIAVSVLTLLNDKLTTYMTGSDVLVDGGLTSILDYSS